MHIMKAIRKHKMKFMAVLIVVIMGGFVLGPVLRRFGRGPRPGRAVGYYGYKNKISAQDLALADRELEILKQLGAQVVLRSQDLHGFLLGELLFSSSRESAALLGRIKQAIRANQLSISEKQINDIFRRSGRSDVYWLLLTAEAEQAGVRISSVDTATALGSLIPKIFQNETYGMRIRAIMEKYRVPEKEILATFGKLLGVLRYSQMTSSVEALTGSQIRHKIIDEGEKLDAEFVRLDSTFFAEAQREPSADEISAHFERYKKFFAGEVNEANPYGLGYKLPERVALEYLAVKLDDISATIKQPTQEEGEEFYQKNVVRRFTTQVRTDANDPNSPLIPETKSFPEVAERISRELLNTRINSKAKAILQRGEMLAEAGFADQDADLASLSVEQLRELAVDYNGIAAQLSKEYGIKVHSGRTSLLSATDIRMDRQLGALYQGGGGYGGPRLAQLVFAIEQLQTSELDPGVRRPVMYDDIGPLEDWRGEIMAVVRVVEAKSACEPVSVDETFRKETLVVDPNVEANEVYSVKEKVVDDLKNLAALDIAKIKASQLIENAGKEDWDKAVEQLNKDYKEQYGKDPNGPDVFRLQTRRNLQKMSRVSLETFAIQSMGNPEARMMVNARKNQARFADKLYSLVPADANSLGAAEVMEFEPEMSYYCLKDVSIKRVDRDEYRATKASQIFQEDMTQSQNAAVVQFNPDNIVKRMGYVRVIPKGQSPDTNAPGKAKGAS